MLLIVIMGGAVVLVSHASLPGGSRSQMVTLRLEVQVQLLPLLSRRINDAARSPLTRYPFASPFEAPDDPPFGGSCEWRGCTISIARAKCRFRNLIAMATRPTADMTTRRVSFMGRLAAFRRTPRNDPTCSLL